MQMTAKPRVESTRTANVVALSWVDIARTLQDLLAICHLSFRP